MTDPVTAKPSDTPEAVERLRESQADRFWSKVEKTDGCWNWTAGKTTDHYGKFRFNEQTVRSHRFAYELLIGPIPEGLVIDHLCRNRLCVNPSHLELVTKRENTRRGIGPSGLNAQKTHCSRGHEYSDENTYRWKGRRQCRTCNALRWLTPAATPSCERHDPTEPSNQAAFCPACIRARTAMPEGGRE